MSDADDTMDNVRSALGRKIGPLPAGLWLVGIGGGLVVGAYLRRARAGAGATSVVTDGTSSDTGSLPVVGTGGASYSDPASGVTTTGSVDSDTDNPTGTTGPVEFKNNAEWRRAAVRAAIPFGSSGIAAENTVGKYLGGRPLSESQATLINQIIGQIGPTPTPVPRTVIKPDAPQPLTNYEWAVKGANYLHNRYKTDKAVARLALTKFYQGKPLSPAQNAMVTRAVAGIGSPPQAPAAPAPVVTPKAAQNTSRTAPTTTSRDTGGSAQIAR